MLHFLRVQQTQRLGLVHLPLIRMGRMVLWLVIVCMVVDMMKELRQDLGTATMDMGVLSEVGEASTMVVITPPLIRPQLTKLPLHLQLMEATKSMEHPCQHRRQHMVGGVETRNPTLGVAVVMVVGELVDPPHSPHPAIHMALLHMEGGEGPSRKARLPIGV